MKTYNPEEWEKVLEFFRKNFTAGETPSLDTILYIIGVQELGKGFKNFTKDEKLNLMHLATCRILEPYGIYRQTHIDEEGWPHFEAVKSIPEANQEGFFKQAVIEYFKRNQII